ncbi:MAG: CapA family protein [Bacillota bacterium]|nr:CapA family protein [Bacillota bacterium]
MKKFFCLICLISVIFCSCAKKQGQLLPEPEKPSATSLPEPETRVSFLGVGDNLIHDSVYIQANRYAGGNGYGTNAFDFKPMYKHVADKIASADIAYINQETIPGGAKLGISSYPLFNSPQEIIYDMKDIGFDVFSQATNHTFDKGVSGIQSAYDLYKSIEGITAVGIYKKGEPNFGVREVNGIKVGFVNYTDITNGFSLPLKSEYYIPVLNNKKQIKTDIAYARAHADFVVVLVHWGIENSTEVSARQRELAKIFADNGADAVIGTHPHVIQPIEYIKNTLVVYSLGNFISAQSQMPNMIEGMITFDFVKQGKNKKIENVRFTTLINYYTSHQRSIQVIPLSEYSVELGKTHGLGDLSPEYATKMVNEIIDAKYLG